jgi:4-hydroxy-tetrahydrodipicolinate reductase
VALPQLVIFGITGRMGQCLRRALDEGAQFRLGGALASASSSSDCAAALEGASVAVDFSTAHAVAAHARACLSARVPLVVGATGIDASTQSELKAAALKIAVLIAPNTSLGVAVLHELVAAAALALGSAYDVEISEAHHRMKRDAPSGTALSLGERVASARGERLSDVAISVVRAGDIVGEHTVTFATAGERLEITHRAADRMIFARGALQAAAWLIGRAPGLYGMEDVLKR